MQYRFTSAALTELTQATLYYEQRENGLGRHSLTKSTPRLTASFSTPPLGTSCLHERGAVERIVFRSV